MPLDPQWPEHIRQVMEEIPLRPERTPFQPRRIVLAKGSLAQPHYRRYVERLCAAYPDAAVIEALDTPHNRIPVPGKTDLERRLEGKRTLVLGVIGQGIRRNDDREMAWGVKCTRYWHFNATYYCFYRCTFCYLAATKSVAVSPTLRIFLNVEDILEQMQQEMDRANRPRLWYAGKLQDGLQLDPLCHYSRIFVPFMAQQEKGRLLYLTKSDAVENLLDLEHGGHTILSWSLNPTAVAARYELGAPSPRARLAAARRCREAGYEVRFLFMPLVPIEDWPRHYEALVEEALAVGPSRITLGGLCSYPSARRLMKATDPQDDIIAHAATHCGSVRAWERESVRAPGRRLGPCEGGRIRYSPGQRVAMYRYLLDAIHARQPDLPVSLCLETGEVWEEAGLDLRDSRCNCVLDCVDLSGDEPVETA